MIFKDFMPNIYEKYDNWKSMKVIKKIRIITTNDSKILKDRFLVN